jgi:hypothetical protein
MVSISESSNGVIYNEASTQNYEFLVDEPERQGQFQQQTNHKYLIMAEKLSMAFGLRDALAEMQNLEGSLLDTCRS